MKPDIVRVEMSSSTSTDEELVKEAQTAHKLAPETSEYQNDPAVRAAFDEYYDDDDQQFEASLADVHEAEARADKARQTRDARRIQLRKSRDFAASVVQKRASTGEDVAKFGMRTRGRSAPKPLAPPDRVDVALSTDGESVDAHAAFASGKNRCAWEVAASVNGPYRRLEGDGVDQRFGGLGAGTWWFRVAMQRAKKLSAWSTPVSVTIK